VLSAPATVGDGNVALATMFWHYAGRAQLTVVLKATFAMVDGAVARHAGPGAIATEDRTFARNPSRSVEIANDLVPYRSRCDVTLVGHCHMPRRQPRSALWVRLGLEREGRALLDKRIVVLGKRGAAGEVQPFVTMPLTYEHAIGGPGEPNPVGSAAPSLVDRREPLRAICFGPVSPFWRARKQLLASLDAGQIVGPAPNLPEAMPWAYFQAAPADQQVEPLRGGERVLLDGLDADAPHQTTQLPLLGAVARTFASNGHTALVDLVCDTLAINSDTRTFDLVWRGRLSVEEPRLLADLVIAAGLPGAGKEPDWRDLLARASRLEPMPERPAPEVRPANPPFSEPAAPSHVHESSAERTHALGADDQVAAQRGPQAPFVLAAPKTGPIAPSAPGLPWSPGPALSPAPEAHPPGEETLAVVAPRKASAPAPTSEALGERLLATGMNADEVAALLSALKPRR
jgi:hypothetical protein